MLGVFQPTTFSDIACLRGLVRFLSSSGSSLHFPGLETREVGNPYSGCIRTRGELHPPVSLSPSRASATCARVRPRVDFRFVWVRLSFLMPCVQCGNAQEQCDNVRHLNQELYHCGCHWGFLAP